jgi:uncharacterized protein
LDYPHYQPDSDHRPLDDAELEALDDLLASLPEAMNVELLDGYLTGLLVAPRPLATLPGADWLPVVWGGDPAVATAAAPFASQKQRKRVTMLVLRHLHDIDTRLRQSPKDWQPVFSVASLEALGLATDAADDEAEAIADDLADAQDWCAGFLQAVELDPEGWAAWFDDAALGPALLPIAVLGSDAVLGASADIGGAINSSSDASADPGLAHDALSDPLEVDRLSRAAAEVVLLLNQRRVGA